MSNNNWLLYTHPDYEANKNKWTMAKDFYTGLFLDNPKILKKYIVRRAQGESDKAYEERISLVDYTAVFPHVVDSMAGILFAAEGRINRVWSEDNKGLGDIENPQSYSYKIKRDADGLGTDWEALWKKATIDLIYGHTLWCLVDGVTDARDIPRVTLIEPLCVTNWRKTSDGRLIEVIVVGVKDVRQSIAEPIADEQVYTHYTHEGWSKYVIRDGETVALQGDDSEGTYNYVDNSGNPILPIFRVSLPMNRHVGYMLARKNNIIMNRESSRDQSLRVAEFAKLIIHANDTLYDKVTQALVDGANVLQAAPDGEAHSYITSDHEPAKLGGEILHEKINNFYITAFKEYGNSVRIKTATEIKQDLSSGIGAFLELVSGAVDELENNAFWRLEQSMFDGIKEQWGHAQVKRTDNFLPDDKDERALLIKNTFFPNGVPVGKSAKLKLVKTIAEIFGVEIDENEVMEAIKSKEATETQEDAFAAMFGG